MTEQTPAPEKSAPQQTAPTPKPPAQAGGQREQQPPWGEKPDDFNPDKAWELIQNLRKEKGGGDAELRQQLAQMQAQQEQQRTALATALGIKPDEVSDTDKLGQQFADLQKQILSSERRALAAEHGVPESLLTAGDAEAMRAQAEALVEFAKGAAYAHATQTPPPAFQQNPGQGQGNSPLTPEAQAQAEYEKYFPPTPPRR